MINVDGVEYRNLEEQVQFLTEQYNGLDETFASKEVVNNIASVLNDQQSQITSANQAIANTNQQIQTIDGKFANYVPIAGTQTVDAKIFRTEIALQSPEGEITRLKNINHNIVLTNGNGVNLLNIDEQLQKVQAFGKTLATLEDVASGEGTKVTVGGVVQSTFNADSKADASTVSTLSQTVSSNSQNISSNTLAISGLAQNKADKSSLTGLASETWVNQQISSEATERQQAYTNLQNQIDSEESTRSSQFTTLESAINSEVSTRQSADSNLQSQITTTYNLALANNAFIQEFSAGTNYVRLADGTQICWGTYTNLSTSNYTLPMPFKDTNYALAVAQVNGASGQTRRPGLTIVDSNHFKGDTTASIGVWYYIAIGKWK